MIAISGWLWWREGDDARPALTWWSIQLALNLGWTLTFFGLERPGAGVAIALANRWTRSG